MLTRHIAFNPETRQAKAVHRLIHVSTLKNLLNADSLSAEVSQGLMNNQLLSQNILAAMMDRCATNSASANETNEALVAAGEVERFIIFCFSHLACNDGDQAGFVLLDHFWKLL